MPISNGSGQVVSVFQASAVLTNAQLLALPTTPLVLVPPPGAGLLLRFMGGFVSKDFTAGAYANVGGNAAMYFVYDTVSVFDVASYLEDGGGTLGWMAGASVRQMNYGPQAQTLGTAGTVLPVPSGADLRDTNIGFSIDNGGQNFTGGDAANTMLVSTFYTVVPA